MDHVAGAELVVLDRERERIHQRLFPGLRPRTGVVREVGNRLRVFQQLFRRLTEAIEVGPPGRAGLPPVILQQLARKPARRPGLSPVSELLPELLPRVEDLGGFRREWRWLRRLRPGKIDRADLVQPLEQAQRGLAVFQVIGRDLVQQCLVSMVKPAPRS